MAWTSDDLIASVRRAGFLPDTSDLSSSDILAFADEELLTTVAEAWKGGREERAVTYEDIPVVAGTQRYRIPRRAMGRAVRGVAWLDASGNEGPADEISPLDAWRWSNGGAIYYFEDDHLVLPYSPTASNESIRVRYVSGPPRLVDVTAAARITQPISTTSFYISTTSPPSSVSTATALVDIVRGESPFPTLYRDRIISGFAGSTITLSSSTPIVVAEIATSLTVGERADYVCPRDTTVYPQVPKEFWPVLVAATLMRVLDAIGDQAGADRSAARLGMAIKKAQGVTEPRNQGKRAALVNRSSGLRSRTGTHRWGR